MLCTILSLLALGVAVLSLLVVRQIRRVLWLWGHYLRIMDPTRRPK